MCKSINKQYFVTDEEGVKIQTDIQCSRPDGHEGDHSALFETLYLDHDGKPVMQEYFWSAAAERPVA